MSRRPAIQIADAVPSTLMPCIVDTSKRSGIASASPVGTVGREPLSPRCRRLRNRGLNVGSWNMTIVWGVTLEEAAA